MMSCNVMNPRRAAVLAALDVKRQKNADAALKILKAQLSSNLALSYSEAA